MRIAEQNRRAQTPVERKNQLFLFTSEARKRIVARNVGFEFDGLQKLALRRVASGAIHLIVALERRLHESKIDDD